MTLIDSIGLKWSRKMKPSGRSGPNVKYRWITLDAKKSIFVTHPSLLQVLLRILLVFIAIFLYSMTLWFRVTHTLKKVEKKLETSILFCRRLKQSVQESGS